MLLGNASTSTPPSFLASTTFLKEPPAKDDGAWRELRQGNSVEFDVADVADGADGADGADSNDVNGTWRIFRQRKKSRVW